MKTIQEIEAKLDFLRQQWLKAETDVDRSIIEKRAKLLIWAKEKIQKKQQKVKPDLYEQAKKIFSPGKND